MQGKREEKKGEEIWGARVDRDAKKEGRKKRERRENTRMGQVSRKR